MIMREVRLAALLVMLCALATGGIYASYMSFTGIVASVVPLAVVILLIVVAIFSLELFTQRINSGAPQAIGSASKNVFGHLFPIAAAGAIVVFAVYAPFPANAVMEMGSPNIISACSASSTELTLENVGEREDAAVR